MLQEFRSFVARGNVLDLAIAVVIGAAFSNTVTALTDAIIMPVIGAVTGGLDFSSYFVRPGEMPATYTSSTANYAALKKAGVPLPGYGSFPSVVINFVIVATAVFLLIKAANRVAGMQLGAVHSMPEDTILLREIRDGLAVRVATNPLIIPAE